MAEALFSPEAVASETQVTAELAFETVALLEIMEAMGEAAFPHQRVAVAEVVGVPTGAVPHRKTTTASIVSRTAAMAAKP